MKYDRDAVLDLFRFKAKATDARVDGVGIQAHFWGGADMVAQQMDCYYDPQYVFGYLDTYAMLGRPIQIMEVTSNGKTARRDFHIRRNGQPTLEVTV